MSDDRQLSPYRIEPSPPSPYLLHPEGPVPGFVDLRSYWRMFYKHRLMIVVATALVVSLTALANHSAPQMFMASAQIRIDPAGAELLPLNSAASPVMDPYYYETEYEELQSPALAKRVVEALKLYDDSRFVAAQTAEGVVAATATLLRRLWSEASGRLFEAGAPNGATSGEIAGNETGQQAVNGSSADQIRSAVATYLNHLTITPVQNSRLVTISYSSPSPELSAEIANTHAQEFVKMAVEARTDFYAEAQQFLEARLAEIKKKTEESETVLNEFRRNHRVLAVGGNEKENVTLERLASLNTDYVKAQSERIAAEAEYNLVKKRHYDSLANVQRDPIYNSLRQELESLQSEYNRLAQFYQPKYPKMVELAGQIAALQQRLNDQVRKGVDGVESQYLAAKEKEEGLGKEVEKQRKETLDLNDLSVEFQVLNRDAEANHDLYKNLLARAKETNITQSIQRTNVRIVGRADVPTAPSLAESRRKLSMALMIGLILGCGLAFGREYIDNSIKTPEQAEAVLQVPALAVIPCFSYESPPSGRAPRPHSATSRASRHPLLLEDNASEVARGSSDSGPSTPLVRLEPGSFDAAELVVVIRPDSVIAEAYRTLRTAVLLSSADRPPQIIQFASAQSREGKTVTSVNVALTLAQSGARVLMLDADLRRPRCHRILRTTSVPGLVDLLVGHADFATCVRPITLDGAADVFLGVPGGGEGHRASGASNGNGKHLLVGRVDLLPAGTKAPNPAEILGSRRMRDMIGSLREMYDYVIVDSPPLLPVADGVILSTMVDGVLLVIKGQETAIPVVQQAMARLERVHARVLGTVLNNVDVTSDDYYDYRGYYASYDYLDADDRP